MKLFCSFTVTNKNTMLLVMWLQKLLMFCYHIVSFLCLSHIPIEKNVSFFCHFYILFFNNNWCHQLMAESKSPSFSSFSSNWVHFFLLTAIYASAECFKVLIAYDGTCCCGCKRIYIRLVATLFSLFKENNAEGIEKKKGNIILVCVGNCCYSCQNLMIQVI
jgi:hypothetical protein